MVFQAAHHKAEVRTGWKGCWESRVQHPQRSILGPFGHSGYFELSVFTDLSLKVTVLDIIHPSDLQKI